MTEEDFKKLQEYQNIFFLSEIGALIHDLGKLSEEFVKAHSIEEKTSEWVYHTAWLDYEAKKGNNNAKRLIELLRNVNIKLNGETSSLYDFIVGHHKEKWGKTEKYMKPDEFEISFPDYAGNNLIKLILASDTFDSAEDRSKASDKQTISKTCYSNAFGHEREIDVNYKAERRIVYDYILDILDTCDINKIKTKRREFLANLKDSFSKALGMTARAANDVSLWEHSYMTASITKALLSQSILENKFPVVKDKGEIERGKHLRIFTVGGDFFDFVSQSHTIPDVVGRITILGEIREEIKNLIEAEFLLGNCIYEDDYGLHFLVPAAVDDSSMIKGGVCEIFNEKTNGVLIPHLNLTGEGGKLSELLPNAIDNLEKKIKKKGIDFVPKWINEWKDGLLRNKLICKVCGKGFYCEGDKEEICETCKYIRNKGREEKSPQTRFIDEIAWNGKKYENVALVVLNFDLEKWLNGKYVKSLFIMKYNEKELQKLKDFYNSELCSSNYDINVKFIAKLLSLGALKAWVDGNDRVHEGALNEVKNCIVEFDSSSSFVKSELSNIKTSLENVERELGKKNLNMVRKIFEEELNRDKIEEQLKAKFRELEEFLLGSEYLDEKRKIVKNSTVEEIKEKIFLKTPSPSRLMRVWNNTKEFFEDLSTYICEESLVIDQYVLRIDKSLNIDRRAWEVEISAEGKKESGEIVFNGKNGITVTPHINGFIEKNRDVQLNIKITDRDWMLAEKEFLAEFKMKRSVRGYRTISVSPNMFMFLVPASKVFDLILSIKSRYIERFGKVYGKLPLNMGVVYFKRKTPFFAALDSAKRFTRCFKVQKSLVKEIQDVKESKIITDIGIIELPYKLGDGKEDYYHPYVLVEEGGIALSDMRVKHVLSLEKGDKIRILPSFFDFQFLDPNTRRFDIGLNKENKRTHDIVGDKGPRPYLVEDLEKFQRLKEIFEAIGSWTPIRDVEALAISKRQEWSEEGELGDKKDVYEELIDSALENKISDSVEKKLGDWEANKSFLKESIMEGSFFDAIELFKSIMKMELRGGRE